MTTENIILAVILLLIVGGFLLLRKFNGNKESTEEHHTHDSEDGVCCGRHANCEKGYSTDNLYFDDEELDKYKGKRQEEYTDNEIEEFRQVLYTMRVDEVDTWVHCLQIRGIEIPQAVKDEILLMLQDIQ